MSSDPYSIDPTELRRKFMLEAMPPYHPRCMMIAPDTSGLPEPLRTAADEMTRAQRHGTRDEAIAAANTFLVLSEEWTDNPKPRRTDA